MSCIDSKLAILDCLKGGATHAQLADEYTIGTSTIGDIKKEEANIRWFTSSDGWDGQEQDRTQGLHIM